MKKLKFANGIEPLDHVQWAAMAMMSLTFKYEDNAGSQGTKNWFIVISGSWANSCNDHVGLIRNSERSFMTCSHLSL
jgi:hypothetical protein